MAAIQDVVQKTLSQSAWPSFALWKSSESEESFLADFCSPFHILAQSISDKYSLFCPVIFTFLEKAFSTGSRPD